MGPLSAVRPLLIAVLLWSGLHALPAWPASAATEQQIKAVFVFNFSHFVQWPPQAQEAPEEPFVIGVLGGEAVATQLDQAVRNERVDGRPLLVRRFRSVEELQECRILFIDRSAGAELDRVLAALDGRSTLTVSDLDRASQRGVMIQFATENNRVRLRINVDSARAAGLTISSNLLRAAEIVGPGNAGQQ